MKGTILYAEYDEGTGISVVTKQTKYGTFTRSVRVHPDDTDIANQYDGCYFAEMKCDIAAYHERAKFMKERAKGILHAFKVLSYADIQAGIDSEDTWSLVKRQADIAYRNAEQAYDTYKILRDSYDAFIETALRNRREARKRLEQKRNQDK